jgi:hypothetical protein
MPAATERPPYQTRQFVWCQFPYMEAPLRPGPKEHIGYIADVRRLGANAHLTVMSLYTTTRPWQPGIPLPAGIIPVETEMARRMRQKGFVLDARRVAFLPIDLSFFPRLAQPDKGVVFTASLRFHRLVEDTLKQVARRPEIIVKLGPDTPGGSLGPRQR